MTALQELIARLEKASAGDRDLDSEIHFVITDGVGCGASRSGPHYTTSIDAALTLVPKGMHYEIDTFPNGKGEPQYLALVAKPLDLSVGWSEGKTDALALCIAALEARQPREAANA